MAIVPPRQLYCTPCAALEVVKEPTEGGAGGKGPHVTKKGKSHTWVGAELGGKGSF